MNIDRDTALRIAMAERTLPDVDLTTLIGILDERLGPPLDLDKRSRITVTDLKTGIGSLDGEEDGEDFGGRSGLEPIKLAVRELWGETTEDDNLPIPESYGEGDMRDRFAWRWPPTAAPSSMAISAPACAIWSIRSQPMRSD